MKHAVLGVARALLPQALHAIGPIPLEGVTIPYNAYAFISRDIVGKKKADNADFYGIATQFPQVLPYIVIRNNDHYLMYVRKGKTDGQEDRLKDQYSIGVGGHVEYPDIFFAGRENIDGPYTPTFDEIIQHSATRELEEEVGYKNNEPLVFTHALLGQTEVSRVHIGLVAILDVADPSLIHPSAEITDPFWVHKDELVEYYNKAEEWSCMVIGQIINGN